MPPKTYWILAGLLAPFSAAIEGENKPSRFYQLGNYELALFKKLNVIKAGDKTLEIGCGPGRIQAALVSAKLSLDVHGTDFAPTMIKKAKHFVSGAHFTVGNGRDLHQYQNQTYDLVYSFVVFQHVDQKIFTGYLSEVKRILRPGGFVVFQIQSSEHINKYVRPMYHPWLLRRYSRKEIYALLNYQGFTNIYLYNMRGHPNPKAVDNSGFLFVAQRSRNAQNSHRS